MSGFTIDKGIPLEGVTVQWAKRDAPVTEVQNGVPYQIKRGETAYTRCVCAWCSAHEEIKLDFTPDFDDALWRYFVAAGWGKTNTDRLICHSCVERRKQEEERVAARTKEMHDKIAERQRTDPTAQVREPTTPEIARIANLIEQHFADGRYDEGWSDKRIGELLSLPVAMVIKVRAEAYGDLRDTALEDLQEELAKLREKVSAFGKKLAEYERGR